MLRSNSKQWEIHIVKPEWEKGKAAVGRMVGKCTLIKTYVECV